MPWPERYGETELKKKETAMSISGIGNNQVLNNLQATGETRNEGRVRHREDHNDEDGLHARHAEQGGRHGFMKSVLQTLKELGVVPSAKESGAATVPDSSAVAVTVTLEITTISISSSTVSASDTGAVAVTDPNSNAGTAAATGAQPADKDDHDGEKTGGMREIRHALHAFMHSLIQALSQVNPAAQAPGEDDDDDDGGFAVNATPVHAAYGNTVTNLQGLAQSLSLNEAASTQSASLDALNNDFQKLLEALGANSAAATDQAAATTDVTLQSFLQALSLNLSNNPGANTGGLGIPGGLINSAA